MYSQAVLTQSTAPTISAIEVLLNKSAALQDSVSILQRSLALQIAHNLRFQHSWTELRIHTLPIAASGNGTACCLSGLPPERLYIHPDEQIALLQRQKSEGKTGMPQLAPEREWVLPSHLREKWSLRRFGEAFDAVEIVPDISTGTLIQFDGRTEANTPAVAQTNEWRTKKRFLLATLDDDSTVVYYIVHDGIVKPRQN